MSKISARWVLRMLTDDHKRTRLNISRYLQSRYEDNSGDFIERVVTLDETRERSGLPPPKKLKRVNSAGKVMASIFWDSQGVIMIDYLEQGRKINGAYYAGELRRLFPGNRRKRRGKLTRSVLLLQDNAPAHPSHVAMTAATKCGFEILPHPPYSPNRHFYPQSELLIADN